MGTQLSRLVHYEVFPPQMIDMREGQTRYARCRRPPEYDPLVGHRPRFSSRSNSVFVNDALTFVLSIFIL